MRARAVVLPALWLFLFPVPPLWSAISYDTMVVDPVLLGFVQRKPVNDTLAFSFFFLAESVSFVAQ